MRILPRWYLLTATALLTGWLAPLSADAQSTDPSSSPADSAEDSADDANPAEAESEADEESDAQDGDTTETLPAAAPRGMSPEAQASLAAERERMRVELREEMARTVRREVSRQLDRERAAISQEVERRLGTVEDRRWRLEEYEIIEQPRLEFFEIDGDFRVRPDMFIDLFLYGMDEDSTAAQASADAARTSLIRTLHGDQVADSGLGQQSNTLSGADMRLRLSPTFHVSEAVRLRSRIDVFDNLVLGATPAVTPGLVPGLSNGVEPPLAGDSWLSDSLVVKRLWAEVELPYFDLVFGRMPEHWGRGLVLNSGDCADCDSGDTADRLQATLKLAGHYLTAGWSFDDEGATTASANASLAQPYDLDQLDDANRWHVSVARTFADAEIERLLGEGKPVLQYGLYGSLQRQAGDSVGAVVGDPGDFFRRRDVTLVLPDLWGKLQLGDLTLELELAGLLGRIGNDALDDPDTPGDEVSVMQIGGVVAADYQLPSENLRLGVELGFASGDAAPGFGALPGRKSNPSSGDLDGAQYGPVTIAGEVCPDSMTVASDQSGVPDRFVRCIDTRVTNFRFDGNYHIDRILFRQLLGTVTDVWYLRPSLLYHISDNVGLALAAVYSQALMVSSTLKPGRPAIGGTEALPGATPLGLEGNLDLFFDSGDGFHAGLSYGLLFPLDGLTWQRPAFDSALVNELGIEASEVKAKLAQTIQAQLRIQF